VIGSEGLYGIGFVGSWPPMGVYLSVIRQMNNATLRNYLVHRLCLKEQIFSFHIMLFVKFG